MFITIEALTKWRRLFSPLCFSTSVMPHFFAEPGEDNPLLLLSSEVSVKLQLAARSFIHDICTEHAGFIF